MSSTGAVDASKNALAAKKDRQFELLMTLGRGAHSDVVLVVDRVTKEQFAVKRIAINKRTSLEQAKFEADSLMALSHSNVVRAYAYWVVHDERDAPRSLQIQLERAKHDLLTHVRSSNEFKLSRAELLAATRQLLAALGYLHAHDVVHRDVKLANILVFESAGFTVKLSDLSLANCGAELAVWPSAGSLCTKAPECSFPHTHAVTPAADLYSLGVALFASATSQMPFCAHSVLADDEHDCGDCVDFHSATSSDAADACGSGDAVLRRVRHICVAGSMSDALAALPPSSALAPDYARLLTELCRFVPSERPTALAALRSPALQYRLRGQLGATRQPVAEIGAITLAEIGASSITVVQKNDASKLSGAKRKCDQVEKALDDADANKENRNQ